VRGSVTSRLDGECEWLVTNGVLPTDLVTRNRGVAEAALRPWTPVFTHGDLQLTHVFVDGDEITGVIDRSEAAQGDLDLDVIRAWWSLRSLLAFRWLIEHGFDPSSPGCEIDVLRSRLSGSRPDPWPTATAQHQPHIVEEGPDVL
jgi:phosphotransferase family enzyme